MFKQKSDPAPAKLEPADAVQQARTRARQRLIGAIVLVAIGIIGFPLVFETQPRPIPVDIPIEIPRRDAAPPLTMPPARPSAGRAAAVPDAAPSSVVAAPHAASEALPVERTASRPAPRTATAADATPRIATTAEPPRPAPASAVAAAAAATAAPTPASTSRSTGDGERARALLEGRPVAAAEEARFVVQVGAFADAEAARETRKQVEKLGFKTYTQVAQTASGSRIRVRLGPFATRDEAEAALAKVKTAGLAAVLLTL
jgi:DedD protein